MRHVLGRVISLTMMGNFLSGDAAFRGAVEERCNAAQTWGDASERSKLGWPLRWWLLRCEAVLCGGRQRKRIFSKSCVDAVRGAFLGPCAPLIVRRRRVPDHPRTVQSTSPSLFSRPVAGRKAIESRDR